MDASGNQLSEQMNWVDYCDSLSNEHAWPQMQLKASFQISARKADVVMMAASIREKLQEPA